MKWLVLLLGIACNAGASVMVKLAVTAPRHFPSMSAPMDALRNWPFWLGLALYGSAFLLYSASLTKLPLNVAHPIMTAGAIVLVACVSALFFRETLPWTTLTGITLIVAGVCLITLHAP